MPGNRGACFIIWVTTEETAAPQCGCTQLNDQWGSTSLVSRSDEHCDDVVALPSALLKELEEVHGRALQSLSVYVAALEDVLRQVERDSDRRKTSPQPQAPQQLPDVHVAGQESEVGYPAVAAIEANFSSSGDLRPRLSQQLGALVAKKLRYGSRDFRLPVLMLLLPLSVLLLFAYINQTHISRKLSYSGPVEYSLLNVFGHTVAFYTTDVSTWSEPAAQEYEKYLQEEQEAEVRDLGDADPQPWLQKLALNNYRRYRSQYIIGAQFRSTSNLSGVPESAFLPGSQDKDNETAVEVTAWHSGYSPHSSAVSLVAASRAFLPGWRLRVVNHPLPKENPRPEPDPTIVLATRLMCAVFMPVGLAFLGATYVLFPVEERVRNVKLLQLQCGASSAAFWGSALAVDLVLHACCSMVILSPLFMLDRHQVYSDGSTIEKCHDCILSKGCLTWDKMSAGRDVCIMLLVGVALFSLVTLIDSGLVGSLVTRSRALQGAVPTAVDEHRSVKEERARVQQIVARRAKMSDPLAAKA
ncbi:hypothetical protein HPB52_005560 [Rhipicephalus sanguineus]|uniref:Uncharacterized protein n=1 Tax=Rhipicephalus sanguineus TaxID=34632 RepID=A0A9D4Q4Z5_RHISA|nr:hypothetical protein HPB52_005560 [Rhipicephalus sanguineus]